MEQATVTTNRRLERGDGPLGGVAAGLADYFGIDVTIVRLGLVATTLLGGPTIPVVYVAAWLIIPAAEHGAAPVAPSTDWAGAPPPPPVPPAPTPPAQTQPPHTQPTQTQPTDPEPAPTPAAEVDSSHASTATIDETVADDEPSDENEER